MINISYFQSWQCLSVILCVASFGDNIWNSNLMPCIYLRPGPSSLLSTHSPLSCDRPWTHLPFPLIPSVGLTVGESNHCGWSLTLNLWEKQKAQLSQNPKFEKIAALPPSLTISKNLTGDFLDFLCTQSCCLQIMTVVFLLFQSLYFVFSLRYWTRQTFSTILW